MSAWPRHLRGFTLIELMVTIALVGTAMAIAVPSYLAYARNATVSRAAASFVQAVHLARSNALRQSRWTVIALRDPSQGWPAGWVVFTDRDSDMAFTPGTDELLMEQVPLDSGVLVALDENPSGTLEQGFLRFNAAGFPRTAGNAFSNGAMTFRLEQARPVRVVYSQSGRVKRCTPGTRDCDE
jgi:prepilin-type N-terminal cleavage/methylation domain-containing protein